MKCPEPANPYRKKAVTTDGYGVLLWSDRNVLELDRGGFHTL